MPTYSAGIDEMLATQYYLEFPLITRERTRDARHFLVYFYSQATSDRLVCFERQTRHLRINILPKHRICRKRSAENNDRDVPGARRRERSRAMQKRVEQE